MAAKRTGADNERWTSVLVDTLTEIQAIHGTSGDEGRVVAHLEEQVSTRLPRRARPRLARLADTLVVSRGKPRVAVFAHLDTVGFTAGHGRTLIDIGRPAPADGDPLRAADPALPQVTARVGDEEEKALRYRGAALPPGTRLVYDNPVRRDGVELRGAYLDDRLGVALALLLLAELDDVAVAFTSDEEHAGKGALLAGDHLHHEHGIARALILDVTWDTEHVKVGRGPAVSLRDASLPRQSYLDEVLAAATASGVRFQHEVESTGGSDGGAIGRSPLPIDWCFVGPPSRGSHTCEETASLLDVRETFELYRALVPALSR